MADIDDLEFEEEEFDTPAGGEEGDPLSSENEYTDEEDEVEAASDLIYDPEREAILAELRAEGAPTVRQGEPEAEEATDAQHEARIDIQDEYEPGHEESLQDRFAEEKAAREAREFFEWSREYSAQQAAAREAAKAPPPVQSQIPEPTAFELMDDATFTRILEARDAGLDYLPQSGEVDAAAVYGQFSRQSSSDEEGDF